MDLAKILKNTPQLVQVAGFEPNLPKVRSESEAYRFARVDRRTRHFQPLPKSIDASIYESQDLMHSRVRSECLNNAQFKRVVDVLTDIVIGTGIRCFADPIDGTFDLEDDFTAELNYAVESDQWFDEWGEDPKQCDVAGKLSIYDMQRLAMSECVQVGDAFLVRSMQSGPGRIVPVAYQMIERDQLDTSKDRPGSSGQNKILNGIEVDQFGREVAFHFYDVHPHDCQISSLSTVSQRIPAERVIHLYAFRRPGQTIGVTWLHALAQTSFDRDKFLAAELQTAAKAALMALYVKRENPHSGNLGLYTGGDDEDDFGNEEIALGSDPLAAEIRVGEDVGIIESNRPNPSANNFFDLIDHDAAGAANLSYYSFTGRFEKTNYTGFRGALQLEDHQAKPIQNWFARELVLPIRKTVNAQLAAAGKFRWAPPTRFARELRRYQRFDAVGVGRGLLDPEKEQEAAHSALRGGFSTLKIECAKRGLHWIYVLRQIALENKVSQLLGVVLDHSKGQGGQTEQTTRQAEAETADESED